MGPAFIERQEDIEGQMTEAQKQQQIEFFREAAQRAQKNPEDLFPDRDGNRMVNSVVKLRYLEIQLPLCRTIEEVEAIRINCQGIQTFFRENHEDKEQSLVTWAKQVAMRCQLRISQLQEEKKARKNGEVTRASNFASVTREAPNRSDAKLVNSLPKEELEKQLEKSQSIQNIAKNVRKERGPKTPKSSPEQLAAARERYYKRKAKNAEANEQDRFTGKKDIWQRFRDYWTKEKTLLLRSFPLTDFEKLESRWIEAFRTLRQETEKAKQERDNALAKLKQKIPSGTQGGVPDEVQRQNV